MFPAEQSITMTLTHDQVRVGLYSLGFWEGVRGMPVTCRLRVGTGPGVGSLLSLSLESQFVYYVGTPGALMSTTFPALNIPAVTSVAPVAQDLVVAPAFPGLAQLRITAKVAGVNVPIHSDRGIVFELITSFYIVEREAAVMAALLLAQRGGQQQ